MESDRHETTTYEILTVRLRGDDAPRTERLWATRVEATDDGGTYRLSSNGFFSQLVIDDVVEARRAGHGSLQITDVRERGGRPGWLVHLDEDDRRAESLIAGWRATGTVVEQDGPTVSVALAASGGPAARPTEPELLALCQSGRVVGYLRLSGGTALTEAEAAWMDFRLERADDPAAGAPRLAG